MIERFDAQPDGTTGDMPFSPPLNGRDYVLGELGLPLSAIMDETGFYDPSKLGGEVAGIITELAERFDVKGYRSPREIRKLKDRIPPDIYDTFAIPDDTTQDPVATNMPQSENEVVVFVNQQKPWSGRSRASAEKIPGSTRSRKYKLREGRVLGGRGPGRYGKKKRF